MAAANLAAEAAGGASRRRKTVVTKVGGVRMRRATTISSPSAVIGRNVAGVDEVSPAPYVAAPAVAYFATFDIIDAIENSVRSCRPIVDLFYHRHHCGGAADYDGDAYHRKNEGKDDDDIINNIITMNQRRDAICGTVRNFKNFDQSRARRLFGGMFAALSRVVEEESYFPPLDKDDKEVNDLGMEAGVVRDLKYDAKSVETIIHSIQFLGCCADLVEAYLQGLLSTKQAKKWSATGKYQDITAMNDECKRIDVIYDVYEVASTLHDLLFSLQGLLQSSRSSRIALSRSQSSIFTMCETWWYGNFVYRERMVTQLVPLLLVRGLSDDAKRDDIRRLCSVRQAINLLDFDDASSTSLKTHLLRTVGNPLFLKCGEGRRFVTHLFLVDASFVCDVHGAVMAQISGATRNVLESYAEIYYSAWRASTEMTTNVGYVYNDVKEVGERGQVREVQSSIEENAIQGLIYYAIHSASPSTSRSARIVLDRFHLNKKSPDVESMLHRSYCPVLWRGLISASSIVRARSAMALADTFPLRNPNAREEGRTKAVVGRSVSALVGAMGDVVPRVRVAGSAATARILSCFWTMIPIGDIWTLLNYIVAVHSSDASTTAVRAAAVDAVSVLLEEGRTHAVLRPLLPSIGNLIHDRSDKVRLSVINMLLIVKKIQGMKFYHVVPANHLLARLADEGRGHNDPRGPVARTLSDLLSNSFFPPGKSGTTMKDIINRTMRLLADNPLAAIVFYRNAHLQLSVNSISKLIAALAKCLCFFVINEKKMNGEDVRSLLLAFPDVKSIKFKGGRSSTSTMATIAEGRLILWESLEAELGVSKYENLADVFTGKVLTEVYRHFESKFDSVDISKNEFADCSRACVAILHCAGKLEARRCQELRAHIVNELRKKRDFQTKQLIYTDLSPNIAVLCRWGMTEDVVACLASSIRLYFNSDTEEKNDIFNAGKSEKLTTLDINVCMGILGSVLKGSHSASASLRSSILESETAFDAISSALLTAKSVTEQMINGRVASYGDLRLSRLIGASIECYGRLLIHKISMKGDIPMQLTPELRSLMKWATGTAFPSLVKPLGRDRALLDLDMSGITSGGSPISAPVTSGFVGDLSFMDDVRFINVVEDNSGSASTRAALICGASSVVRIFAEWLSIRLLGDTFVTEHMSKLCKLSECSDQIVRKTLLGTLSYCNHLPDNRS